MQLSGELAKVNLPNLLQLVKTGGLTGKINFSQGAKVATVFIEQGLPIHAEVEGEEGVEGFMELFLWTSGTFSFDEETLDDVPVTIAKDDPETAFERLLKEGMFYQEVKQYLDRAGITPKSVLKPTGTAVSFAKQVLALPGLERLDGKKTLAEALSEMHLTKREYVKTVASWLLDGVADLQAPTVLEDTDKVELPNWVISRLKQDNPDISQAIVDMVIWVDRVKCWMFQVDVDFYRIRKQIEEATGVESETEEGEEESFDAFDSSGGLFSPPTPPPAGLSIYAPVNYSDANYWRSSNYYQGGNLFKSNVIDSAAEDTPVIGAGQTGDDTTGSGSREPDDKKIDPPGKQKPGSSQNRSIEF